MVWYRRARFPGGYYFFTVVTFERRKLFTKELGRRCLRHAIEVIQEVRPFVTIAICLLPEHLHCVWKLPEGDADYSQRWASIKSIFSREYRKNGGTEGYRNCSRRRTQEAAIWQRRFWEHQVRDEDDLQHHVNYIHFNPVKHHLVEKVDDWPWSTYHKYVKEGYCKGRTYDDFNTWPEDMLFGE